MKPIMVVGTKPEIIKPAPVIKWLQRLSLDYVFSDIYVSFSGVQRRSS